MSDITHNDSYAQLIKWMVENKIQLSSLLKISESPIGGVGVFATSDLSDGDVLLSVPKSCVLSPVTCGIANLLQEHELDGMVALTIAYMFEKCQGSKSPWYSYLETIQSPDVLLPRFWPEPDRNLLKGTELQLMGGLDESEVIETYNTMVAPFIEAYHDLFGSIPEYGQYEGYKNALVQVCSRAFEVDEFRGLSLVPGACLFNHSDNEDVHFESQAEVCDMCGAAEYCEHIAFQEIELAKLRSQNGEDDSEDIDNDNDDNDDNGEHDEDDMVKLVDETKLSDEDLMSEDEIMHDHDYDHDHDHEHGHDNDDDHEHNDDSESDDDEEDSCEIVLVESVSKGNEIFNTYGDYSNGILLSRYGFAIWDNLHETVGLGSELSKYAKLHDLKPRLKWWAKHFYQCIFDIDPNHYEEFVEASLEENPDEPPPPSPDSLTWKDTLEIVSSGQPTPGLILVVNLLALSPKKFTLLQNQAKRGKYTALPTGPEPGCIKIIRELISKRLSRYEDGRLSSSDYKDLLNQPQTDISIHKRLAFTVLGTEKLVLERCLQNL